MNGLPEPPDLEPDEDRVVELGSVVPPPADEFADAVRARLDQEALATHVATLAWSVLVGGFLQLFDALLSLLSAEPWNDHRSEDEDE